VAPRLGIVSRGHHQESRDHRERIDQEKDRADRDQRELDDMRAEGAAHDVPDLENENSHVSIFANKSAPCMHHEAISEDN
jgi:hypothetical protein